MKYRYFRKGNLFKDLCDRGVFLHGNVFHIKCLWFCFNKVIQQDLDFVKLHWNTRHIRPSRHDTTPGKPDELFFLPELSGCEDQLIPILQTQVDDVISQFDFSNAAEEKTTKHTVNMFVILNLYQNQKPGMKLLTYFIIL